MDEPTVTTQDTKPKEKDKKSVHKMCYLIVALLLLAGAGAYWWRNDSAVKQHKTDQAQVTKLQDELKAVTKTEDTPTTKTTSTTTTSTTTTAEVPTAAVKESIIASIKSDNTATLEGYMASTVGVIIAASGGIGNRTPTQAVSDLSYLNSAIDPWDFALSATTLASYKAGFYKDYFKSNSVVGKSADGYVIVFNFDTAGKIDAIFLVANDSLL